MRYTREKKWRDNLLTKSVLLLGADSVVCDQTLILETESNPQNQQTTRIATEWPACQSSHFTMDFWRRMMLPSPARRRGSSPPLSPEAHLEKYKRGWTAVQVLPSQLSFELVANTNDI